MNYRTMTPDELLSLWEGNRNNEVALMAADEMMNRIRRGDLAVIATDELNELKESQNEDHA